MRRAHPPAYHRRCMTEDWQTTKNLVSWHVSREENWTPIGPHTSGDCFFFVRKHTVPRALFLHEGILFSRGDYTLPLLFERTTAVGFTPKKVTPTAYV